MDQTGAATRTASAMRRSCSRGRIVFRHGDREIVEPVQFTTTTISFADAHQGETRVTRHMQLSSAEEHVRVIREYGPDKGCRKPWRNCRPRRRRERTLKSHSRQRVHHRPQLAGVDPRQAALDLGMRLLPDRKSPAEQ